MIYPVTMYAGKCDNCGKEIKLGGGEYSALGEAALVEEEMMNSNWKVGDGKEGEKGKHYCFDCWYYDDDDNFCLQTNIQKKKFINTPTTDDINEAIALFEGWKLVEREVEMSDFTSQNVQCFEKDGYRRYHYDLKYHSSWDWLMPVVENIETMGNDVRIYTGHTTITANGYPVHQALDGLKINATYKAVHQFIQWYNKQNDNE